MLRTTLFASLTNSVRDARSCAYAGLTVWFDHLDMLLNLGKAEGSVDAGQMIKPALARGTLHMVGATTRTCSESFTACSHAHRIST